MSGPDEYFGLLMPQRGQPFTPFAVNGFDIRAAISALPGHIRPELRWYTIRAHNPAARTIDVDVVTHGDSGPGSRWIRNARPGDSAGMFTCPALWTPPIASQVLVADASALPALRHILGYQSVNAPDALRETDVVAVVTSGDEVEDGLADEWGDRLRSLTVTHTDKGAETAAALSALRGLSREPRAPGRVPDSVWVSGEGGLVKAVRQLAVNGWGIDSEKVVWVPFWFHGRARP